MTWIEFGTGEDFDETMATYSQVWKLAWSTATGRISNQFYCLFPQAARYRTIVTHPPRRESKWITSPFRHDPVFPLAYFRSSAMHISFFPTFKSISRNSQNSTIFFFSSPFLSVLSPSFLFHFSRSFFLYAFHFDVNESLTWFRQATLGARWDRVILFFSFFFFLQ